MKEVLITEEKILRNDEKSRLDTIQVVDGLNRIDNIIDTFSDVNNDVLQSVSNIFLKKDQTVWLEVKVHDSLLSSLLYSWLLTKSEFDNESLHVFGCSLKSIMYSKPMEYSEDVKQAIQKLYEDAFR